MGKASAAGSWGRTSGTEELSPGILISINLQPNSVWQGNYNQFWVIGVTGPNDTADGSVITLAHGYCYYPVSLSWSGFFELHEGDELYWYTVGSRLQSATITARRLVNTNEGAVARYAKFIIGSV